MCQNGLKVMLRATVRAKKRDPSAISSGVAALKSAVTTPVKECPALLVNPSGWNARSESFSAQADRVQIVVRIVGGPLRGCLRCQLGGCVWVGVSGWVCQTLFWCVKLCLGVSNFVWVDQALFLVLKPKTKSDTVPHSNGKG